MSNNLSRRHILKMTVGIVGVATIAPLPSYAAMPLKADNRPKRLLHVDDDPNLLALVKDYLEFRGYEVNTAESSRKALDILDRDRPDLIVSDVMRPGMDGFEFLRNIRQNERTRSIPFLFVSAVIGKKEIRDKGFSLGADACMAMPFKPEELVAQIERLTQTGIPQVAQQQNWLVG
jgi:DNA-binding response OmpR family regulator